MNSRLSRQRGQGIIEFAVVFPLLMFFLFAIFDVGLALNHRATVQHAVREGARYAALSDNSGSAFALVCSRTIGQSQDLLAGPNAVTVTYENLNGGTIGSGDAVDVNATYTYTPFAVRSLATFFPAFGGWTIDMNITGSSRLELALASQPSGAAVCP